MTNYSLESHLKQLCETYPEYTSLLSTWNLSKMACVDALKTVVTSYPHFSLHDISHSEAVITKIEMLLGDRVEKLSPTDTWLILHAAYAHDLGMVLKWEDIEKIWKEPKFAQFLQKSMDSLDVDLQKAAKSIDALLRCANGACFDPLKISRHVTLINAAYFRKYHSEISRKYIDLWEDGLGIDFSHSGLIQSRLVKLLGLICELHTADSDNVLKMDYQTDGYGADYAHPRFVAMMLRLGDLLDADNGRFSKTNTMAIGSLPDSSVSHKDKHESTTHLLVTPREIEFRSDCPTQSAYLETRNFINWLESEIDFLKKNWDLIAPKDLGGYVPRFDKKEVLIKSIPDIEGVAGLKFKISQEKAFQIVEGSNIYSDPFVCFREIIQNAMDASKMQMWKDLTAGNYEAWLPAKNVTVNTQPFDVDKAIYKNYTISVKLTTLADGRTQVDITDRGTGISVAQFKQMCNVGTSTSLNSDNEAFISTMPGWLKPTAGFGIGLQSFFLLVDDFEMITSTGTDAFVATVHSYRVGGYLQLKRQSDVLARGTTVRIKFNASQYRQPMAEETRRYLYAQHDPFGGENYIGESYVIGSLLQNCGDLMFPIHVESSIEEYKHADLVNPMYIDKAKFSGIEDSIRFLLSHDCCTFTAWDEHLHAYTEINLVEREHSNSTICFKGVKVTRGGRLQRTPGLDIKYDVYGLETKEALSLDRASLINPGRKAASERLKTLINFYIERVLDELNKSSDRLAEVCSNEHFNVYVFWQMCSRKQRERIPEECYSYIKETADIICRSSEGKYVVSTKPVSDILTSTEKTYFATYRDDMETNSQSRSKIHEMCGLLNVNSFSAVEEIVVDGILTSTNGSHMWDTMLKPIEGYNLIIYTTGRTICCDVSSEQRKHIVSGLTKRIPDMYYLGYMVDKGKYYAIPAIKPYEDIAVFQVPRGVSRPNTYTYWIIAPFAREMGNKVSEMSKEMYVNTVMEAPRFENIVAYVKNNRTLDTDISIDRIKDCYRKLIEEFYDVQTEVRSQNV